MHCPDILLSDRAKCNALPDGSSAPSWTNVLLPQLSMPGFSVFLCEYGPAFLHADIRRRQLGGRLALDQGGPLGILSVKELVIEARSRNADDARWRRLLAPLSPKADGAWRAGRGPAVRLAPAAADRVRGLVFEVDSLPAARAFLGRERLLGAVSGAQVRIAPSRIQGLDIRLAGR